MRAGVAGLVQDVDVREALRACSAARTSTDTGSRAARSSAGTRGTARPASFALVAQLLRPRQQRQLAGLEPAVASRCRRSIRRRPTDPTNRDGRPAIRGTGPLAMSGDATGVNSPDSLAGRRSCSDCWLGACCASSVTAIAATIIDAIPMRHAHPSRFDGAAPARSRIVSLLYTNEATDEIPQALCASADGSFPAASTAPSARSNPSAATPLFISRARGARIEDVDGNTYIDYVMSWGPLIHGHAPTRPDEGAGRGGARAAPASARRARSKTRLAQRVAS